MTHDMTDTTSTSQMYVSIMTGTIHTNEYCSTGRGRSFSNTKGTGSVAEVEGHPYAKGCKRCGSAAIVAAAQAKECGA